ncbi:MAG: hypothetical protein ACFCU4_05940 [Puniceicoccaceae bacterium]
MRDLRLFIPIFLIAVSAGQPTAKASTKLPLPIPDGFRILAWNVKAVPPEGSLFYQQGEELVPIDEIADTYASKVYPYEGDGNLLFFGAQPGTTKVEEGKVVGRVNLTQFKLPLVLLSRSDPGSSEPYRALSIEDSTESFPLGSYRFINATDRTFAVQIGDERALIQPLETVVLSPRINGAKTASFKMIIRESSDWKPFRSNAIRHLPNRRVSYLIFSDNSGSRPVARGLSETAADLDRRQVSADLEATNRKD